MYWFSPLCVFKCALMTPSAGQYSCSWWNCLTFLHCAFSSNVLLCVFKCGLMTHYEFYSPLWIFIKCLGFSLCRPIFLFLVEGHLVDFMHGADSGRMRDKIGWGKLFFGNGWILQIYFQCLTNSEKQNSGRMQDTIGWGKCIELFWKSKNDSFGMVDWESGFIERY